MYVQLILPLALGESYHYRLDNDNSTTNAPLVGRRVVVSFGPKRFFTGVITKVSKDLPPGLENRRIKVIDRLLDEQPILSQSDLDLWEWVADYYHCTVGQVMRTAMPSGLLPESKTLIYLNPDFVSNEPLCEQDYLLLDALKAEGDKGLTLQRLQTILTQNLNASYQRLLSLGAIHTEETVISRYRPRMRACLRLVEAYRSPEGLTRAYETLTRSKRQQEILADFLNCLEDAQLGLADSLPRQSLSKNDSTRMALIRKLVERGIMEVVEEVESRLGRAEYPSNASDSRLSPLTQGGERLGSNPLALAFQTSDEGRANLSNLSHQTYDGVGANLSSPSLQTSDEGRANLSNLSFQTSDGGGANLLNLSHQTSDEDGANLSNLAGASTYESHNTLRLDKAISYLSTSSIRDKQVATIQLVRACIESGHQVLVLSPSAEGVPSASEYLKALEYAAQGRLYYYHPQISEDKRTELFQLLATQDTPCLILGTRSAVFLPFTRLGLIIVDDEQEYMYKQQHIAPYYHARDVALYLAQTRGVRLLLTSATPSAEATFNTLRGKYHPLDIPEKPIPSEELPSIKYIDIATLRRKGLMPYNTSISPPLKEEIEQTLARGERVLLLQNRRGYAHHLHCRVCNKSIDCPRCNVSLNYYATERLLRCLYCDHLQAMPLQCPHCHQMQVESPQGLKPALHLVGFGAERVAEEVEDLFPDSRVMRLDSDSLQTTKRRSELHARIAAGDVDIIVGTQLIKGQPIWDNIGLIAVIQLESLIAKADFRNSERVYQLLYQLMLHTRHEGTSNPSQLVIQTNDTAQPFLAQLKARDYKGFIQGELQERQVSQFPPFTRMSTITLKGFDEALVIRTGEALRSYLAQHLEGIALSELSAPSIARIDGQYIRQIVCRRPYKRSYHQERRAMTLAEQQLRHYLPESRRVQIHYDIDPL